MDGNTSARRGVLLQSSRRLQPLGFSLTVCFYLFNLFMFLDCVYSFSFYLFIYLLFIYSSLFIYHSTILLTLRIMLVYGYGMAEYGPQAIPE